MVDSNELIWREYYTRLHSFIQSRVGNSSIADDILQEVFVRIHSRINTLKESSKIQSWIYQITRNAIIYHYRLHKTKELPEALASPESDSSEKTKQEIEGCIFPMIQSLPEHYRKALMLSEIEGLTQREVAAKQGLSLSGAKSRIQRGREMVKEKLLNCCKFEFDHRGSVIDYKEKGKSCDEC